MNNYKEVPFDIELAKKHPESIFTWSGKEAKQVTFFEVKDNDYSIRAVVEGVIESFTKEGHYIFGKTHSKDLVIRIPVEEVEVTVYCFKGNHATAFTAGQLERCPNSVGEYERFVSEGEATKTIIKMVKP